MSTAITHYDINTQKGYEGWKATSETVLDELPNSKRILQLRTAKSHGGINASARVFVRENRDGFTCETSEIFSDFIKNDIAPTPCKRITEKAILNVHRQALQHMDDLIAQAQVFYLEKRQSEKDILA